MIGECNISGISIESAKVIIAALEYYANGVGAKHKNKILKFRKEDSLVEELKTLKEKIEYSEVEEGTSVKDVIAFNEELEYRKLLRNGKTTEELKGMFMYR